MKPNAIESRGIFRSAANYSLLALTVVIGLIAVSTVTGAQAPRSDVALQTSESGARLFRTNCATCHGSSGKGDGPLAAQMRKVVPDLTKFTIRNGGVFPADRLERIVDGRDVPSHGDRDMPVWGDVFRRQAADGSDGAARARINAIVRFLQSIQERPAE